MLKPIKIGTPKASPKPGSQSRVGLHTKGATMTGYHYVHWGPSASYNRNFQRFRLMSTARDFAKRIGRDGKYQVVN